MISLTEGLPKINSHTAEWVKIKCLFDAYSGDKHVLFWHQDNDKAVMAMTDGNMIILNNGADISELSEFVSVLSPACIFSDYETLCAINRKPEEIINIMHIKAEKASVPESDNLKSDEVYRLLDVDGLSLPEYPCFAVDYCRRLNMGKLDLYAIKNKCCAVSFKSENSSIMNGIASHQKGYGTIALKGILNKNAGNNFFVCCRNSVKNFYEKNGFKALYQGGYWVKNK